MSKTTAVRTVEGVIGGSSYAELEDAVAVLCTKFGASIAFDIETSPEGRKEIIERLAKKKVRVRFHDASPHERQVAISAALPVGSMMICAGFAE